MDFYATALTFWFPPAEIEGGYITHCGAFIPYQFLERYDQATRTFYFAQDYFLLPLGEYYEIGFCYKGLFHGPDEASDPILKEGVRDRFRPHVCIVDASEDDVKKK